MTLEKTNQDVRISSRDIADITGKNHNSICRDIRKETKENPNFSVYEDTYTGKNNQERLCYYIPIDIKFFFYLAHYGNPAQRMEILNVFKDEDFNPLHLKNQDLKDIFRRNAEIYIYAFKDVKSNLYKIGVSSNTKERKLQLQREKKIKLFELHKIKARNRFVAMDIESAIHRELDGYAIGGEWFETGNKTEDDLIKSTMNTAYSLSESILSDNHETEATI